jgi:hypothetical protein
MLPKDNLPRLIIYHQRRLQKLKEREAAYGLNVDPGILIEIEDIEEKIVDLEQQLENLNNNIAISAPPGAFRPQPHIFPPLSQKFAPPPHNTALKDIRQWLLGK